MARVKRQVVQWNTADDGSKAKQRRKTVYRKYTKKPRKV